MDRGSVPRQVQDHHLHLRYLHPRPHPEDYRRRAQHRHRRWVSNFLRRRIVAILDANGIVRCVANLSFALNTLL